MTRVAILLVVAAALGGVLWMKSQGRQRIPRRLRASGRRRGPAPRSFCSLIPERRRPGADALRSSNSRAVPEVSPAWSSASSTRARAPLRRSTTACESRRRHHRGRRWRRGGAVRGGVGRCHREAPGRNEVTPGQAQQRGFHWPMSEYLNGLLSDGSFLFAVPVALLAGVVAGLNPCCLPMYPAAAGCCTALRKETVRGNLWTPPRRSSWVEASSPRSWASARKEIRCQARRALVHTDKLPGQQAFDPAERGMVGTLRLRLLKIGATVTESVRRIVVSMPSSYP